ncbi:MAG: PSD1 and planctomycete cytochrome C domain-containing protein [Planctomycetota bacterium]|nr:PSD1 and planctomycete cytochrome C domain-containing protein [Planctomycetota bacterium]
MTNRQPIRCFREYVAFALGVVMGSVSVAADEVNYDRDIRPILATKCFRCHGSDKQESGLRLDLRRRALAEADGGIVIEPGKSGESDLIRRVVSTDEDDRMPPAGARLTTAQIELLRTWIDQGAKGMPDDADPAAKHWAFRPILRPVSPAVSNVVWPRNAIDRFVLSKLEDQGIAPSPEAPRQTLIRRLYLDLIGLPPSWERVAAFDDDQRPDAYERLVDELLASPHYGERWGRHWLDLARYADSSGYEADTPREIWAYRDWVINALNADLPFDQFVTEQLAGDLLPNATIDQRIATGFHCNAMLDPGVRHESIIDRVNTTGAVFLGLTTGCAQCHSHKTDPLTHREFYELYAFFNEATITQIELASGGHQSPDGPSAVAGDGDATDQGADVPRSPQTLVMQQTPQPTHIFLRGDRANPGDLVEAGLPAFLHVEWTSSPSADRDGLQVHPTEESNLTRLDLARWLLAVDNPLTARVTANRIWQRFLGVGIVATEADFGIQTPAPLHGELLDYLASELRIGENSGWQGIKSFHRLIVTSATYRQSSNARHDLAEINPGNRLIAHQIRFRVEAEFIRDVSLAASGLLSNKLGGPSVFPYQADGILENRATPASWTTSAGEDRYRRGMYTWVWRLTPHPNLPLFDAPDGVTACTHRDKSNVPVQALTLLNDPTFVEAARSLAARIATSSPKSDAGRIGLLARTCLSRDPTAEELKLLQTLISNQRRAFASDQTKAAQIAGDTLPPECDPGEFATWVVVSRVVMNLDEFITRE